MTRIRAQLLEREPVDATPSVGLSGKDSVSKRQTLYAAGVQELLKVPEVAGWYENVRDGTVDVVLKDGADIESAKKHIRGALARCVPVGNILGEDPQYLERSRRRGERMPLA